MSAGPSFSLSRNLAWREVDGELFVVTLDGALHRLKDPVSTRVFLLVQEQDRSREDLIAALVREFDAPEATIAKDLDAFTEDLESKGVFVLSL